MNDRYFVCCEECFETIGRRNTRSAKLWMDLCAIHLKEGVINLHTSDFPELRTLELLGFIVSTEKPQDVLVKIKGHHLNNDGQDFFCVKDRLHAS